MRDEFYDHIEMAADRIVRCFLEALTMIGVVSFIAFAGFCLGSWH